MGLVARRDIDADPAAKASIIFPSAHMGYKHADFVESHTKPSITPDEVSDGDSSCIVLKTLLERVVTLVMSNNTVDNEDPVELNRFFASTIAHCCSFSSRHWVWSYGVLQNLTIKSLSNSQLAVNIIAANTPLPLRMTANKVSMTYLLISGTQKSQTALTPTLRSNPRFIFGLRMLYHRWH